MSEKEASSIKVDTINKIRYEINKKHKEKETLTKTEIFDILEQLEDQYSDKK